MPYPDERKVTEPGDLKAFVFRWKPFAFRQGDDFDRKVQHGGRDAFHSGDAAAAQFDEAGDRFRPGREQVIAVA